MVIYAKLPHRKKIDALAPKLGIDISKDDDSANRHVSEVVREAIDHLYLVHFPEKPEPHPLGFADIKYPANGHNYHAEIENAQNLTLVFNDMKRWLPRHLESMRARIEAQKPTHIFMLHPENPYIAPVADVSDKAVEVQKNEIKQAVTALCDELWDKLANLKIYGHRRFNSYTVVMTETKVMANYYPIQKRYNDGYIHVYESTDSPLNMYRQFAADLDELARDCEDNVRDHDLIKMFQQSRNGK